MTDTGVPRAIRPTSDKLIGIHKLWSEIAAGRIGPRREEVTPARLRGTMPWTFVVDVAGGDFRFRFAGDRIIQFMGTRLTGTLLSDLLGTPFYDGMNRFFAGCVTAKTPTATGPSPATYPGKEHLEMEVLVLPLSDDGVTVTGLLGTFDTWRLGTHTS
ncbi:MAG TPA: PAS domain-containing protein [Rhizomicrobium sp.]|jgi:hypothetical protein|nr:PAS domain-containing protein [Rhizomicrobium sp.]